MKQALKIPKGLKGIAPLRKRKKRHAKMPGTMPGTIQIDPEAPKSRIHVISYDEESVEENPDATLEQAEAALGKRRVTWIHIEGLGDEDTIRRLGKFFKIHRLALEDVVSTHQRCKIENYQEQYYVVARLVDAARFEETEQLSLFLGTNYILTFQESAHDAFAPVKDRIRNSMGIVRKNGADYLCYALLDALIDEYFPAMDDDTEKLDKLEIEILTALSKVNIAELYTMKSHLRTLRRAIEPLRLVLESLRIDKSGIIEEETKIHMRDAVDHVTRIVELIDLNRELATDLANLYPAYQDNRMNEVMKVLTVFAAIFIPLNFIAAVYGMNFSSEVSPLNMPELYWYYGYPMALGLMASVAFALLYYFYRKGWIFGGKR